MQNRKKTILTTLVSGILIIMLGGLVNLPTNNSIDGASYLEEKFFSSNRLDMVQSSDLYCALIAPGKEVEKF